MSLGRSVKNKSGKSNHSMHSMVESNKTMSDPRQVCTSSFFCHNNLPFGKSEKSMSASHSQKFNNINQDANSEGEQEIKICQQSTDTTANVTRQNNDQKDGTVDMEVNIEFKSP